MNRCKLYIRSLTWHFRWCFLLYIFANNTFLYRP